MYKENSSIQTKEGVFPVTLWTRIAAALLASGVAAGAFGAHYLRATLDPSLLAAYEKGVFYQLIHSLGLLVLTLSGSQYLSSRKLRAVVQLLFVGTVVFSGSLYILAISGERWLGAITPIGGICFIAAWLVLAIL